MNLQEKVQNYGVDKLHYISVFDGNDRPNFLSNDANYENIEKLFALSNLNIFNSFDDVRGDSCDDGGFKIILCERKSKYYLYILWVNYNGNVGQFILTEDDPRYNDPNDGYDDFVIFDTLADVEAYLTQFVSDLDFCVNRAEEDSGGITSDDFEFYGECLEDFETLTKEEDTGWSEQYCAFLEACYFAYSEYFEQNTKLFQGLTKESKEDLFELKANVYRAEYQMYVDKLELFKHKILNPVDFEINDADIQMIIQAIKEDEYVITSECLYVKGMEYEIELVLRGEYNRIVLESAFDLNKMTRYVEARVLNDDDVIDDNYKTRSLTVSNKAGKMATKDVRYFKKVYNFEDLLKLLLHQIESLK